MPRTSAIVMLGIGLLVGRPSAAVPQVPLERQFAFLLSTLSPSERDEATLLVPDGDELRTYRQGAGAVECIADPPGDHRLSLICYHKSIGAFLAHQRLIAKLDLDKDEYWRRVCGDVERGVIAVPDRAYVLSASAGLPPDGATPDSITVYHLLQLPYATEEALGLTDEELVPGTPWIHHAGNCDAHVMWSEVRPFPRR